MQADAEKALARDGFSVSELGAHPNELNSYQKDAYELLVYI